MHTTCGNAYAPGLCRLLVAVRTVSLRHEKEFVLPETQTPANIQTAQLRVNSAYPCTVSSGQCRLPDSASALCRL